MFFPTFDLNGITPRRINIARCVPDAASVSCQESLVFYRGLDIVFKIRPAYPRGYGWLRLQFFGAHGLIGVERNIDFRHPATLFGGNVTNRTAGTPRSFPNKPRDLELAMFNLIYPHSTRGEPQWFFHNGVSISFLWLPPHQSQTGE